jgi:hypothetical protein
MSEQPATNAAAPPAQPGRVSTTRSWPSRSPTRPTATSRSRETFERESDGVATETEAAKATGDELQQ